MKNDTYSQMRDALGSTGRYDVDNSKYVNAEIKAYAASIDKVKEYFNYILRELFVQTACSFGLSAREEMFDFKSGGETVENRRKRLIGAFSAPHSDFDYRKFGALLEENCSDAGFVVSDGSLTVSKQFSGDVNAASRLSKVLFKEISPNLKINLTGTGRTFNQWENDSLKWLDFESYDLMWDIFDKI